MIPPHLTRRAFNQNLLATAASSLIPTVDPTRQAALNVLAANIITLPNISQPVLIEGSTYRGIWQECGPHEALVYAQLDPSKIPLALNNHRAFFAQQRPDGQLPASIKPTGAGFAQIQMAVPIAATAWELAQLTQDHSFLEQAYQACALWDHWLRTYRDTRKTGLVEGFCTYDTGQDNSPRWAGIPNRCPQDDARLCPPHPGLPRLCPDLSATVYGARIALAAMAAALGRHNEQAQWLAQAEHLRGLVLKHLYDPVDAAFYDLDPLNRFVRIRSDVNTRVLGEHVLNPSRSADRSTFAALCSRQLHNPAAFWTPFPFPSIALDDPTFVRPIPPNSWGGASQALTALRATRWMPHYGLDAELKHLMRQWVAAIERHGEFRQQLDPISGDFTQPDPGSYTPTALLYLDFTRRLRLS